MIRLLPLLLVLAACANSESTVVVVRHAEAFKNLDPQPDLPPEALDALTPRGEAQARALAEELGEVDVVLCSPTGRTRETAALLGAPFGLEPIVTEALAPLRGGTTPEGDPATWAWREAAWAAGEDPRPEGGESLADGVARAQAEIARYSGRVVVVTHGDIAAGLIGAAAGTPVAARWGRHAPAGGSATELEPR